MEREKLTISRKDLIELIDERGGNSQGLDLSGKRFTVSDDYSHLNLIGIILDNAKLSECHLEGSDLTDAHLIGCSLERTHLEGAKLTSAHLKKADLVGAHLVGADLSFAHLNESYLMDARLEKANLVYADLKDADLSNAHLEGAYINWAKITEASIGTVNWGDYIIGEETEKNLYAARHRYRHLKNWYTNNGYYDIAAKFYYREKEANRKSLNWRSKSSFRHRLAAESMRGLFGYGERWKRILIWVAVVIFGLAAAYYFWGSFSSSSFWDTLYYSATSFTALGYGQWAPQPTGWAKGMGAAEAIIGVFMMALLLVTFVRKWTR